jgi:Tetratricopeptide repeat
VRQLESELHPPAQVSRAGSPVIAGGTRSNPPPAQVAGNSRPSVTPGSPTPLAAAKTNPPVIASIPSSVSAPAPVPNLAGPSRIAPEPPRPTVRTNPPKGVETLAVRRDDVEVTQLASAPVIKPAQELGRTPTPTPDTTVAESPASSRTSTNALRRGFFSRLNPFGGRNRTNAITSTGGTIKAAGYNGRYTYLSPAAPTPGDVAESERAFKRGVKAQRAGSLSLAITEYQAAVKADAANYDAYYNLGLAALERGDSRLSLWAYEIALALKPSADDAQYNFALALKAGGYWEDAAEQLQALLAESPADARAHLSLANLCAQQLQQTALARAHYQRFLELNPKHPEAAKIRYWLTANP